ncbi:MAG TPA: glycosyltransferase family 1 protein [Actinomycetota bacterium]|nr:glycosyltransferase family 1 protein [Actinomycetota bacterium]
MRFLVDARPALDPGRTGVGRYARRLVEELPAADPGATYVAWYLHARGLLRPRRSFPPAPNLVERATRFPARVFQPVAWRLGVPRVEWLAGRFDALLATNFLPPATGALDRSVLVVHDLAFERHPETAPHIDGRWRRRFAGALAGCAAVIVPSTATRDDLVELHGVGPERIHVVPHGVRADAFAPPPDAAERARRARERFGIGGRYVLFLGGIEPRKNLARLVRAFALAGADAWLVLAGGPVRWSPRAGAELEEEVARLPGPLRARVVRTGYVADEDRLGLLWGAELLAYPSLAEGFGFPVLEAFAAGVPVLASRSSSLPEVAGEAALLVDPLHEGAIAEGIRRLLEDGELRARLRTAGLERCRLFTWRRTAEATASVLRAAAARG